VRGLDAPVTCRCLWHVRYVTIKIINLRDPFSIDLSSSFLSPNVYVIITGNLSQFCSTKQAKMSAFLVVVLSRLAVLNTSRFPAFSNKNHLKKDSLEIL